MVNHLLPALVRNWQPLHNVVGDLYCFEKSVDERNLQPPDRYH
jgi:hypothetical protein